jgi:hypothetical protein
MEAKQEALVMDRLGPLMQQGQNQCNLLLFSAVLEVSVLGSDF